MQVTWGSTAPHLSHSPGPMSCFSQGVTGMQDSKLDNTSTLQAPARVTSINISFAKTSKVTKPKVKVKYTYPMEMDKKGRE